MNYLEEYYANYDEEGRLLSKHGQVEYLTTMKYIQEVILSIKEDAHDININSQNCVSNTVMNVSGASININTSHASMNMNVLDNRNIKILEVGAGTGRYSIALAKEGYQVDALEYTRHNLEIMNSKIDGIDNIKTHQGNALDLSRFVDESFDITMVLGPMYHMYTKEDKIKVLEEAIRVTKKSGYILVAYCMNEATMIQFTFKQGKILDCVNNNMLTEDFRCISEAKDLFEMVRLEEIDELDASFDSIKREKIIAADGASCYMRDCLDAMDDATFDMFMKYHFATCERMDLIGATNHSLDILQKQN